MNKIFDLALTMIKIGLIGFGGGNALVPVLEQEVVVKKNLISKKEFEKQVVVANITPGALPIEIASGIGRCAADCAGMIIAAVSMALPGALLTFSLILLLMNSDDSITTQFKIASIGISMLIISLLFRFVFNVLRENEGLKNKSIIIIIIAIVFLLTGGNKFLNLIGFEGNLPSISTIEVIWVSLFAIAFLSIRTNNKALTIAKYTATTLLLAFYVLCSNIEVYNQFILPIRMLMFALGVLGLINSLMNSKNKTRVDNSNFIKELFAWLLFLVALCSPAIILNENVLNFQFNSIISTLMSFGGGDAYLSFGHGVFVDTGIISNDDYYGSVVAVSNMVPGSIIAKVLTGVGLFVGEEHGIIQSVVTSISGFACGVGVSGITFLVAYYFYSMFEHLELFKLVKKIIRPVIAGLLLSIVMTLLSMDINNCLGVGLDYTVFVIFCIILFVFMVVSTKLGIPLFIQITISIVTPLFFL